LEVRPQLSVYGRWLLVQRVRSGRPVAHVAAELGVSRATGYKWWRRWREEGPAGLGNRSSRPRTSPTRTSDDVERRVLAGTPVRYERDRPGELVHFDIKKLGRLRDGGGWRVHGRDSDIRRRTDAARSRGQLVGHEFVHSAVDDHSRLAYCEVLPDEQAATAVAFWGQGAGLLRRPRRHRRAGADRQRLGLPLPAVARTPDRGRDQPQAHPALPSADQLRGCRRASSGGLTRRPTGPWCLVAELSTARRSAPVASAGRERGDLIGVVVALAHPGE
jgi:hypothetical protein